MIAIEPIDLPVHGVPVERADAARNRQRILEAAERLFARDGVACTSMDAIAARGRSRQGNAVSPFWGPRVARAGTPRSLRARLPGRLHPRAQLPRSRGTTGERLIAFGQALLGHLSAHGDLLLAAETAGTPGSRFGGGPYGAYRAHVTMLSVTAPDLDAEYVAEALLAPSVPRSSSINFANRA